MIKIRHVVLAPVVVLVVGNTKVTFPAILPALLLWTIVGSDIMKHRVVGRGARAAVLNLTQIRTRGAAASMEALVCDGLVLKILTTRTTLTTPSLRTTLGPKVAGSAALVLTTMRVLIQMVLPLDGKQNGVA
tara:strand:- start:412 stop:807 length:396 start_codon:yes stop_codon:yes gene_type:complete